ncbi:hypothetical protein EVAR_49441_1 [Eumeta japonica]|uniref:Uncharacterized protein n=1 Tax=Eumeta variegata TaxID=151549 RepID=A0A4C1Y4W0_EUMVA|nr:hypothetical protein EVAR_49441_1 [Eumeta japonica]
MCSHTGTHGLTPEHSLDGHTHLHHYTLYSFQTKCFDVQSVDKFFFAERLLYYTAANKSCLFCTVRTHDDDLAKGLELAY